MHGRGRRHRGGRMMGPMMDPRSRLFMALANDQRIKIIDALKSGEKSSSELIAVLRLDPSVVSRHLMFLRNVGLVAARKEGVSLYFQIADDRVLTMLDLATKITKDWFEDFQQFFV
jgi:ArsR family transcriptional regulator